MEDHPFDPGVDDHFSADYTWSGYRVDLRILNTNTGERRLDYSILLGVKSAA